MATIRPPSLPSIPDLELDSLHMDLDDDPEDEKSHHPAAPLITLAEHDDDMAFESTTESSSTILPAGASSPSVSFSRSSSQILPHRRSIPLRFASPTPSPPSRPVSYISYAPPPDPTSCYLPPPLTVADPNIPVYESYTLTYHRPTSLTTSSVSLFGGLIPLYTKHRHEPGRVVSIVPNPHFSQAELRDVAQRERGTLFPARTGRPPSSYACDLEARLRGLDWKVQDEIWELLGDRTGSTSTGRKRREWRVAVLIEVEGGDVVDGFNHQVMEWASGGEEEDEEEQGPGWGEMITGPRDVMQTGGWKGALKRLGMSGRRLGCGGCVKDFRSRRGKGGKRAPLTEYRLILRGREVRSCDSGHREEEGWRWYNRYSRPWREVDEKEEEEERKKLKKSTKRWSSVTRRSDSIGRSTDGGLVEKYVDF
ncbi:hypothetical protein QBC42DRAFT_319254 [Cladorrhinum samala]|uniref:Uncharacterized protein n=1 Tax=Cladorrhinum samala TaxID=585594 RepID=A0AAV9I1V5_9PEZI|nr:hypothetical protein QBC42DRAFT_319254 [Cladorrhinum samala]